ncbi:hypothetical protein [Spiroplasma endosymbiont of Nebria brevicollis]|uniref:hypothetical protein n=1 Tax=Spiroplasma endosymbiont of Nebria brevicollis TaxID=3066284 RepID=UPI00313EF5CF
MNKNDIIKNLNKLSDKDFNEIFRNYEQKIKIIEKKTNWWQLNNNLKMKEPPMNLSSKVDNKKNLI